MAAADSAAGALTRLAKETALIEKKPVPGVKFVPGGDAHPLEWMMHVTAPEEYYVGGATRKSPYGGRVFTVKLKFPTNYPFKHPDMTFTPGGQLYHPNVNKETGEICADTITRCFGPTKNVTDLAKMVMDFLKTPNLEHPLDPEMASTMASDIAAYEKEAAKHAASAPKA